MIEIGYRFPHNGAVVLATAPADNDSVIVLVRYGDDDAPQYVTGRVYVGQLPHPDSWHHGTYSSRLEDACEILVDRSLMLHQPGQSKIAPTLAALIRNIEAQLQEVTA